MNSFLDILNYAGKLSKWFGAFVEAVTSFIRDNPFPKKDVRPVQK